MSLEVSAEDRVQYATEYLMTVLVMNAPYDTGNLAMNSIRVEGDGNIHIGGEIAPYAIFTNEKWNKGINPNEGWIQRAISEAIPTIKSILGGVYAKEEIDKQIDSTHVQINKWQDEHADKIEAKGGM